MWGDIAIAFLLAFVTAFIGTPYTIKLARKVGALTVPNNRNINNKPIPRIGGIAVIVGFILSAVYLTITMCIENKLELNDAENYKMKLLRFLARNNNYWNICLFRRFKELETIHKIKCTSSSCNYYLCIRN